MFTSDVKPISSQTFMQEYSPTLPAGFPKNLLPENLCESSLLKLAKCVVLNPSGMACQTETYDFAMCKRKRDTDIYASIKKWEIEQFKNLDAERQQDKLAEMSKQVSVLKSEKDKLLTRSSNESQIFRYNSDIVQLQWRQRYLAPLLKISNHSTS